MSPEKLQMMLAGWGLAVQVLIALVVLVISIGVLWFLMICFQKVPEAHRKQNPALVWLLLIPCFNLVWSFFVLPKLADSYKSYFDSIGKTDVGDCGRMLALLYCILVCVSLIPFVNCLASPAALVVGIIFLVKAASLKNMIQDAPAAPVPPAL